MTSTKKAVIAASDMDKTTTNSKSKSKAQRIAEKRAELKSQLAKLDKAERIQEAQEAAAQKKQLDRKKYILGAWVLAKMKDPQVEKETLEELSFFLKRDSERAVFGFPATSINKDE